MLIRGRIYVHREENDIRRPAQRGGGGLAWRCTTAAHRSTKLWLILRLAREKPSSTRLGRSKESFINILNIDQDGTWSGPLVEISHLDVAETLVVRDFMNKTHRPLYIPMRFCPFLRTTTPRIPGSYFGQVGLTG